jgi:hypothetical protein
MKKSMKYKVGQKEIEIVLVKGRRSKSLPKVKRNPKPEPMDPQREKAIEYVRNWVQAEFRDYLEPVRAGIPKGTPIGFSPGKKRAAHFMVLYPTALDLRATAKISEVRPNVLQVWRTQDAFKDEIVKSYYRFAQAIWNATENDLVGWERDRLSDPENANRMFKRALDRLKLLRFFNPTIFELLMLKAAEKLYQGFLIYVLFAPGQYIPGIYQVPPFWRPTFGFLTARKTFIEAAISQLADPKIRETHTEEEIRAFTETIKNEIADIFYGFQEEVQRGFNERERRQFEIGKTDPGSD